MMSFFFPRFSLGLDLACCLASWSNKVRLLQAHNYNKHNVCSRLTTLEHWLIETHNFKYLKYHIMCHLQEWFFGSHFPHFIFLICLIMV